MQHPGVAQIAVRVAVVTLDRAASQHYVLTLCCTAAGAVKTIIQMLGTEQKRAAAVTMLGKTVEQSADQVGTQRSTDVAKLCPAALLARGTTGHCPQTAGTLEAQTSCCNTSALTWSMTPIRWWTERISPCVHISKLRM